MSETVLFNGGGRTGSFLYPLDIILFSHSDMIADNRKRVWDRERINTLSDRYAFSLLSRRTFKNDRKREMRMRTKYLIRVEREFFSRDTLRWSFETCGIKRFRSLNQIYKLMEIKTNDDENVLLSSNYKIDHITLVYFICFTGSELVWKMKSKKYLGLLNSVFRENSR